MQAIKQSSLLRPISRSSSPAPPSTPNGTTPSRPDSGVAFNDVPSAHSMTRPSSRGALNRLGLSSLRGRPPASTPAASTNNPALVQDGSYLEALALKVSEAISKALAAPTGAAYTSLPDDSFNGRRALPTGRGAALMSVVAVELKAAKDNQPLSKAILRLLHRPMSVMLTNLNAQLLPVLSSSKFHSAESGPAINPTAAQLHALALSGFASEVLAGYDELGLGLAANADTRGDGLQSIREGLVSVITRILNPLFGSVKLDLLSILSGLENAAAESWTPSAKLCATAFKSSPVNQSYHPCINSLHSRTVTHSKLIAKYASVGGKVCDPLLAGLHISLVWRALVAIAHRKPSVAATPTPPSSNSTSSFKKRLTPPSTPRMAMAFKTGTRPPSPPSTLTMTPSADARAVFDLLGTLPKPTATNNDACEAVDEVYDDLSALAVLHDTLDTFSGQIEDRDLDVLTEELPTLIAIPVLLKSSKVNTSAISTSVSTLLGMEEHEYRHTCLASFSREEGCAETVVKKLLEVFTADGLGDCVFLRWLKDQVD